MTGKPSIFLRFDGQLSEHLEFKRHLGWETDQIAHRLSEGDGEYRLSLLDSTGRFLTTTAPNIDFGGGCGIAGETRSTRVVCYLPLHDEGRSLVFSRGDVEIWREDVAETPPKLEDIVCEKHEDSTYRIRWTAKHVPGKPLRFNVFFFSDRRFGLTVARDLCDTEHIINISDLPGGKDCQFGVLTTDGVRSAIGVSAPFERPIRPTVVHIIEPARGETLPFGQPTGARGIAFDQFGNPQPDDSLEWMLDGKKIQRGARLIPLPALEPGLHRLSLRYVGSESQSTQCEVEFVVTQPGPELEKWARMRAQVVSGCWKHDRLGP